MMRSGSVKKILLVSQQEEKSQLLQELQSAGVPVEVISPSKSFASALQKNNSLILLNPFFDELCISETLSSNQRPGKYIFILTDDERWKQKANLKTIFYLPLNTHPLELARMLVEKLNLPTVSNKPSYAFSFFQF